jgi:hypothetical protein
VKAGFAHPGDGREFDDIDEALHDLCGRPPWECSLFDVDDGDPSAQMRGTMHGWESAEALRRELHVALDERRGRGHGRDAELLDRGGGGGDK